MSDRPIEEVSEKLQALNEAAHVIGTTLDEPFMAMAFLSLPVIPKLKISDLGLIDVEKQRIIGLFEISEDA
jgi:adenine deaminase